MENELTIAVPEGKDEFELYCCVSCGKLISVEQEREAMRTGILCSCGSLRYRPTKVIEAEQDANGDYVITGRYGETVTLAKAIVEANYKSREVPA